jgi:hypothetical protein
MTFLARPLSIREWKKCPREFHKKDRFKAKRISTFVRNSCRRRGELLGALQIYPLILIFFIFI